MIIFFTLIFTVFAKAKERTEYENLLLDLLETEKEKFLNSIARRIFDDGRPEFVKKSMTEQDAKAKTYHENGKVPSFEEFFKKKLAERLAEFESTEYESRLHSEWSNSADLQKEPFPDFHKNKVKEQKALTTTKAYEEAIFKEWNWYKEYSEKLEKKEQITKLVKQEESEKLPIFNETERKEKRQAYYAFFFDELEPLDEEEIRRKQLEEEEERETRIRAEKLKAALQRAESWYRWHKG